jgi:hypothetical protein
MTALTCYNKEITKCQTILLERLLLYLTGPLMKIRLVRQPTEWDLLNYLKDDTYNWKRGPGGTLQGIFSRISET